MALWIPKPKPPTCACGKLKDSSFDLNCGNNCELKRIKGRVIWQEEKVKSHLKKK